MKRFQLMGALAAGCLGTTVGACADEAPSQPIGFEIKTAPLTLEGIQNACYDIRVRQKFGSNAIVWGTDFNTEQAGDADDICASQYGISNGSITYIGTCDSDDVGAVGDDTVANQATNTIELAITDVYSTTNRSAAITSFQNPCPIGAPCKVDAVCKENADTLVPFNITLMREANQGFFDIAVNFEDIFCSAKFDTCYEGGDRIKLLFQGGSREDTGVLAIACTRGPGSTNQTEIFLSDVTVTCGATVTELSPTIEGNSTADFSANTAVFGYAVYRGQESANDIVYWNTAIGFKVDNTSNDGAANCKVTATASAGSFGTGGFVDAGANFTPPGTTYPLINVNVPVTAADGEYACVNWGLNEVNTAPDPDTTPVATVYSGTAGLVSLPLEYRYSGEGAVTPAQ